MGLPLLKYVKGWFNNNFVEERHWDEITSKTGAWATEVVNDLKQIGLDIGGSDYQFNGVGKAALTSNLDGRVAILEAASLTGPSNLGLDVSTNTTVKLVAADQTDLSTTNLGQIVMNSTTTAGEQVKYSLSANLSVALTGGDFGFASDLTDYPLWVLLIDTGSAIVLGVTPQGGLESVTSANCKTVIGNCTARTHIMCSSAVGSASNCYQLGWVKAAYTHTGAGGGEKLWAIQASQGDANIGTTSYLEVSGLRF